jgi:DNA-binding transcriptional LysR family regulator
MNSLMPNISLLELDLFLRVSKLKSLRESARQLGMTSGAVSKILKRLEKKLGITLLRRSVSGVLLTPEGKELVQLAEGMVSMTTRISPKLRSQRGFSEKVWSIGSISFLSSRLISGCVHSLAQMRPNSRFRIVEFTHNELVSHGLNGAFEISLHIGSLDWTRVWSSRPVGKLRWALYASADHPLSRMKTVSEQDVIRYPFTVPTDWSSQGFTRGEDHCPVPWGVRFPGHEAVTAETSIEIVQSSQQITFVPTLLARKSEAAGQIREIHVQDWPVVEKQIYLSIRDDMVSRPFLKSLTDVIGEKLSRAY